MRRKRAEVFNIIMFIKVVDKFKNTKYISDAAICEIEDAEYVDKVTIKTMDGSIYYKYGYSARDLIGIINNSSKKAGQDIC